MFAIGDLTRKMAEGYIQMTGATCSKSFIQYNISAGFLNASTCMVMHAALQFFTFHPIAALHWGVTGWALRTLILPEFVKFNMPGLINRAVEFCTPQTGLFALRALDGYPLFKPFLAWPN